MPRIERADASVWYEDLGPRNGERVLLLHGGFFDPMTGERFWITPGVVDDLVAAGYRCLVPDRRHCGGRTSATFGPHTFGIDVNDAIALLDAEGIQQMHIVAGSNGCSVAMLLAARQLGRTKSLTLCWPGTQDNTLYHRAIERSLSALQQTGTADYLTVLRETGVPRLHEERPGWPFGVALLHDTRAAESFLTTATERAAQIIDQIRWTTLQGEPLREVAYVDTWKITNARIPTFIVPPEPADIFHDRATAEMLAAALPGSRMLAGAPITPSPQFAAHRASFTSSVIDVFTRCAAVG